MEGRKDPKCLNCSMKSPRKKAQSLLSFGDRAPMLGGFPRFGGWMFTAL